MSLKDPPPMSDRRETERYHLNLLAGFKRHLPDGDETETQEWLDALDGVVESQGPERADWLLRRVLKRARQLQVGLPGLVQSRYINTISPEQEPEFPGDEAMELRIRRIIRWNAAVMVIRANHRDAGLGGHLSTYASAASLYEVGFNHFFRGKDDGSSGDQIFFQGHAAPGIYSRAVLEGRLTEAQLDNFRRESRGVGLSSYPHPRLMPDFWEFPTVSMGLGPINAIYQARYNRYLSARGIADTSGSRVWAFLGDGEMDEVEAQGALTVAAREGLDNLTFVINCNLQRLDGPVRGNGKIIQEMEALFTGAGWNVIKVVWAREWDTLLARDYDGALVDAMNETVDGEWQKYVVESGAYIREHLFGRDPSLVKMVESMSDDQIKHLRRGGHDYRKVYAAYAAATATQGRPSVVLAKTVKGWTLGSASEARNMTHQKKKLDLEELRTFRDRLELPIADRDLDHAPFFHPGADSPEVRYLLERRKALGGSIPKRVVRTKSMPEAPAKLFTEFDGGTSEKQLVSTTMVFGKLLRNLLRDADYGKRVVPIIPDEARTFGLEVLFREIGIYAPFGQRYEPVDSKVVLSYTEKADGQLLEEGHHRVGLDGVVHRRGHELLDPRPDDDPVLHLLLDVRLPADHGSDLGVRRCARSRLPVGRHCRSHDAQWRGPAARGWPQPAALLGRAELRLVRSGIRLRARDDRAGWSSSHVRRQRGHLLLLGALQSGLRAAQAPGGCRSGHPEGALSLPRGRGQARAQGAALGQRPDPAAGAAGAGDARREVGRRGRCVERHEPLTAANRCAECGALESSAPDREAARALRDAGARGGRGSGHRDQ